MSLSGRSTALSGICPPVQEGPQRQPGGGGHTVCPLSQADLVLRSACKGTSSLSPEQIFRRQKGNANTRAKTDREGKAPGCILHMHGGTDRQRVTLAALLLPFLSI